MSRKIGPVFIIEAEPDGKCELCGKVAEVRPYGPGGKQVCFECAMKDEALATRQFKRRLCGEPPEP